MNEQAFLEKLEIINDDYKAKYMKGEIKLSEIKSNITKEIITLGSRIEQSLSI